MDSLIIESFDLIRWLRKFNEKMHIKHLALCLVGVQYTLMAVIQASGSPITTTVTVTLRQRKLGRVTQEDGTAWAKAPEVQCSMAHLASLGGGPLRTYKSFIISSDAKSPVCWEETGFPWEPGKHPCKSHSAQWSQRV